MRYTDNVHYEPASIGERALRLEQKPLWVPKPFAHNPLWARMGQTFDPEHFLYPTPPVDLGKVELKLPAEQFESPVRVLRCPIKAAQNEAVLLPEELSAYEPLVRHVLETELAHNPRYLQSWAHITVERTFVQVHKTQRVPGWHVDGFQGVRAPRHGIEHSYLWSDVAPTQYCLQPFLLTHLDFARHNVFDVFDQEASRYVFGGLENHVYLLDPYIVHRAALMDNSGWRTFVRLTFTETYLDDPVNTVNLSLHIPQDAPARLEVRNRLFGYEGPTPWEVVGLRKKW